MSKAPGPLPGGAHLPGKGLTNTNTRGGPYAGGHSSAVQDQSPTASTAESPGVGPRGGHGQAIGGGAQLPEKGMKNAQTRNSSGVVCQT